MKKDSLGKIIILVIVAVVLTLICMFGLPAANGPAKPDEPMIPTEATIPEDAVSFYATVIEMSGSQLTVEPIEGSNERNSADKIVLTYKSNSSQGPTPGVGTFVSITYDGNIIESYPAQLGTVYKVEVTTPPDNPPQENATMPPHHHDMPEGPTVSNDNNE